MQIDQAIMGILRPQYTLQQINLTKEKYISTEDTHNVYGAELTAIQIATNLLEQQIEQYTNAYMQSKQLLHQSDSLDNTSSRKS